MLTQEQKRLLDDLVNEPLSPFELEELQPWIRSDQHYAGRWKEWAASFENRTHVKLKRNQLQIKIEHTIYKHKFREYIPSTPRAIHVERYIPYYMARVDALGFVSLMIATGILEV